jgi:hypothetical protein
VPSGIALAAGATGIGCGACLLERCGTEAYSSDAAVVAAGKGLDECLHLCPFEAEICREACVAAHPGAESVIAALAACTGAGCDQDVTRGAATRRGW